LKNGTRVKLQLWDTAGAEQYRAITTGYYRGALGVLLVYDITNLSSFNMLKQYWISQVKDSTPTSCVLGLASTKADIMFGEPEMREVFREQAELLSRDYSLVYVDECSSKTGQNVTETLMALAEAIYA
jgi:small GTP-binding protein